MQELLMFITLSVPAQRGLWQKTNKQTLACSTDQSNTDFTKTATWSKVHVILSYQEIKWWVWVHACQTWGRAREVFQVPSMRDFGEQQQTYLQIKVFYKEKFRQCPYSMMQCSRNYLVNEVIWVLEALHTIKYFIWVNLAGEVYALSYYPVLRL